jgi:hypothetical protein
MILSELVKNYSIWETYPPPFSPINNIFHKLDWYMWAYL